jgi:hypothetical protein
MKKLISLAAVLLLGASANAASISGKQLTEQVLKMGKCSTINGAILFEKNGVAYVTIAADGSNDAYGDGAYGTDGGAYGNDAYDSGAYGEDAYSGGAYDDSAYGDQSLDETILETKWRVKGKKVLINLDGTERSVTIGFRSKTCTIN